MRAAFSRVMLGAVFSLALACGYSPDLESGALKCGSSNSCPEGYSCISGACWKTNPAAEKFLGTWSFVAPSTRMVACTDGFSQTEDWTGLGEQFEMQRGRHTALETHYYCDMSLDVAADKTSTVVKPGATCTGVDATTGVTFNYKWKVMLFTLTTTDDGKTGTLEADIPYDYTSIAGNGSCTMHFSGTMSNN